VTGSAEVDPPVLSRPLSIGAGDVGDVDVVGFSVVVVVELDAGADDDEVDGLVTLSNPFMLVWIRHW
jgi:hypothetical protein